MKKKKKGQGGRIQIPNCYLESGKLKILSFFFFGFMIQVFLKVHIHGLVVTHYFQKFCNLCFWTFWKQHGINACYRTTLGFLLVK